VMLKEIGIRNAICYTFGTNDHEEVIRSKRVAEALGFKWLFCPYSTSKWNGFYASKDMEGFLHFTNSYAARPHIMELLAVKELFGADQRYLFLPGHTLDFLSGSHLPGKAFSPNAILDRAALISCILAKQYNSFVLRDRERTFIWKKLLQFGSKKQYNTPDELIADFEKWDWSERQSKFIMSAVDVYSYYGHAWYTPFWEREYMSFFLKVPGEMNYNRYLLKEILHKLFPRFYEKPTDAIFTTARKNRAMSLASCFKEQAIPRRARSAVRLAKFRVIGKKANVYDYGLNMHGCFEQDDQTINEFLRKLRRHHDIRSLHYAFHLSFLLRLGLKLDHLHRSYRVF